MLKGNLKYVWSKTQLLGYNKLYKFDPGAQFLKYAVMSCHNSQEKLNKMKNN